MNKKDQELRKKSPIQIRNKKASFEYFFVDTYTAGIVLTGTEIKSIRGGKASLVDCYCDFYQGELWVKGMNISPYFYGSFSNHEARRDRKLLLTKRELRRLEEDSKQPGFTIVPTLVFIDDNGRAKVDIALCKGKKEYDDVTWRRAPTSLRRTPSRVSASRRLIITWKTVLGRWLSKALAWRVSNVISFLHPINHAS